MTGPFDKTSRVEKRWNTRTGSSVLSTVTADPRRIRLVRTAIAARTTSGSGNREVRAVVFADAEGVEADWSAITASSTTLRSTCA